MTSVPTGCERLVVVFTVVSGCVGGGLQHADAGSSLLSDAGISDVNPALRSESCGGNADVAGMTPSGAFAAGYVYVDRCDGDCESLNITVATSNVGSEQSLSFGFWPDQTGSFAGVRSMNVVIQQSGVAPLTVPATVQITGADPTNLTSDGGWGATTFGRVAGTLTAQGTGVDLSGSFSSPVCFNRIAI